MDGEPKKKALKLDLKARFTLTAISLSAFALALVLTAIPLWFAASKSYNSFASLGLLQPTIAALLALVIVSGIPPVRGRYVDGRRKGETSPSSATMAVRLWLLCFIALMVAIVISALLHRLPKTFALEGSPPKPAATTLEISTGGTSAKATATAKVDR